MFSKNLKYYRLRKNMTKKALASQIGVTPMAITNYENGDRRPDMPIITRLAEVIGVRVADFLAVRNENLKFVHGDFRKSDRLGLQQQEFIKESVEEYFSRFYEVVEILGGEVLPKHPEINSIELSANVEDDAMRLRQFLGISPSGPVGSLAALLEKRGILVYLMEVESRGFLGINGTVNERPYVAVNADLSADNLRSTILHELAHMAFIWPKDMDANSCEKLATKISEAFLLSEQDARREIGLHRSSISMDMVLVCNEYGITFPMLIERLRDSRIISESLCREYFTQMNRLGGSGYEKEIIPAERTSLFEQLVYRAVNEGEISVQKGAELLRVPYEKVAFYCHEVGEGWNS